MTLTRQTALACLIALAPALAAGQERLTLDLVVAGTLARNPNVRASQSAEAEAAQRVIQARASYLPRVDLVESWQRGNQPVFAFSSLLAARQFTQADFALSALNHPDPLVNHRTGVMVEQVVFDGLRSRMNVRAAQLGESMAALGGQQLSSDLRLAATRAFGRAVQAAAERRAAEAAVASATEDARRAEHRRDAGVATEADVLSLEVHRARMRERLVLATVEEKVAAADINRLMREPLDREFVLDATLPRDAASATSAQAAEAEALRGRADLKQAALKQDLSAANRAAVRAAFFPRVALQGYLELSGTRLDERASGWLFGAEVRWNLFTGLADRARLHEAARAEERARAEREAAEAAVRMEARQAALDVEAAQAREEIGRAAVAQARESQRIVRDRYDAGLATVNDLLRAAQAILDAERQEIASRVDLLVSAATLRRALGRTP